MTNTPLQLEQKLAWVYLINLVFYLIPLFITPYSSWQIILILAVLVPFIYCYFWTYRCNFRSAYRPIIAMLVLATVVTPINPGSISLFTFASFFIGFFYPIRVSVFCWFGVVVLLFLLNYLNQFNNLYFPLYGTLLVLGVGMLGVAERRRYHHKLKEQQSAQEISTLATMVERERIARDLHDIMGHSLSSIALKAELAEKLLAKQEYQLATTQLQELGQIARESLSQIRHTVCDYKHKGLASCITQLCHSLRDKGIYVELIGELPKLPARAESQLGLILTELVNNILRHSSASQCSITFREQENTLFVEVKDNASASPFIEGNGLTGIRERLDSLGGHFSYNLEQGYAFTVSLPLQGATV
ncbi:sensor histidine kinase [Shewanella oneidensis MR-1]|uniref:Two component signal transduction system histidine kinase n=1 Tax=Shewanella oneidensis (strain ATCC 700550 / JCM 31522 / CIP 106686 / LMG 19005 / NCIMB 14063 / MR-1) TaxID=211586 RepID=Q8EJV4_SHEON|nr:sensor histidine kinase [Shewanella oneidensis]AAN53437.1 two component signal transduction system histidine kinase [Shewanella oneidensis MR-1]MDX5997696.1 sensor histidine kinase [Shewanella oneidensis]MEE2027046.1 Sensor histidine kinase DesK [Shewanella oneidensis]QKG95286.1 sensor histidine kinase [Shewanella oneidensis MR-1]